jgi:hypothetical protein
MTNVKIQSPNECQIPKPKTDNHESTRLRWRSGAAGENSKARKKYRSNLESKKYFVFYLFRAFVIALFILTADR